MKIAVMGAGAIGSLYGGLLELKYPGSVTLIGRDPLVESVRENGLLIDGVMGNHKIEVDVTDDPATVEFADIVLITTKTYDTLSAARSIEHLVQTEFCSI